MVSPADTILDRGTEHSTSRQATSKITDRNLADRSETIIDSGSYLAPRSRDQTIQINTFIPIKEVPGFKGDNREVGQAGTSRTSQTIVVNSATGMVQVEKPVVGSTHFTMAPITRTASGQTLQAEAKVENGAAVIKAKGNEGNPLVPGAPGITYDLTIKLNPDGGVHVQGTHDGFPAYEVLVDGKPVWSHDPRTHKNTLKDLFPPMEYTVDMKRSPSTPNTSIPAPDTRFENARTEQ